ncbi:hypothetical protein SAMN02745181_0496 [Rubritalea squalenifaciens DSM 18772]|uniref:Lipoprotein n=1 Tax=Rubritalea squalenifaciens DSM 18772 TaxID=1123071 RepID=A0A1M6CJJ5_9BACT|nr:DUF6882 domain-containing protein [Rubritalea squalenifaciens]SHI61177.1 hypothetical protein SAMN02745181_0496 [Rubritalea squalenifaciens DSM 18772]
MYYKKMIRAFLAMTLVVALSACDSKEEVEAVRVIDFDELSKESYEYLQAKQTEAQERFDLGAYERYDWNQEKMQLVWSDAGVPKVVADIQFVGSISTKSNTWLWSWANPTVLDQLSKDMVTVRDFGRTHGLEKLTNEKWPAEEVDGWEMTAIAAKILKAKGAYRSPANDGFTFMIFTDIQFADGQQPK